MKRPSYRPEDYRFGWICALPVELQAAQMVLDEEHDDLPQDAGHSNVYVLGRISDHNVVVVCLPAGQYGTNSAASVLEHMRFKFPSISSALMVGIGGGVPSEGADVRLGDVVVSQPHMNHGGVVQYDLGKLTPDGHQRTGYLNTPSKLLLSAVAKVQANDSKLQSLVAQTLPSLGDIGVRIGLDDVLFESQYRHSPGPDCTNCDHERSILRKARGLDEIKVHYGLIGSGNQVIKDAVTRDMLSSQLGGVLCFEMEAAGLMNILPTLVIRGICDYSDSHKNKKWQPFAAAVAAIYAKEILSVIPANPHSFQREISSVNVDNVSVRHSYPTDHNIYARLSPHCL